MRIEGSRREDIVSEDSSLCVEPSLSDPSLGPITPP